MKEHLQKLTDKQLVRVGVMLRETLGATGFGKDPARMTKAAKVAYILGEAEACGDRGAQALAAALEWVRGTPHLNETPPAIEPAAAPVAAAPAPVPQAAPQVPPAIEPPPAAPSPVCGAISPYGDVCAIEAHVEGTYHRTADGITFGPTTARRPAAETPVPAGLLAEATALAAQLHNTLAGTAPASADGKLAEFEARLEALTDGLVHLSARVDGLCVRFDSFRATLRALCD